MNQSTRAYERLREEIVDWELAPGTHLSEIRLAERLGVSRTPLRQALHQLAGDRLVRMVPGRGAFVMEIALEDVRHLFQLREALETYAARLCARAPHRTGFRELEQEFGERYTALAEAATTARIDDYYALAQRLDEQTDHVAGNPHLTGAVRSLRTQLRRLRRIARRTPERLLRSAEEHALICGAIADGDERRAAELTAAHINNSLRNILEAMADDVGRTDPTAAQMH
ncbi:GntR family transcriptional regulator [Streptomyces sp. BPSDS2]|uniref:GntR family transcriptional regulator n=1 Tax=Streptomyces sp. BPSDS2 TaxID=2571021 RepID=UPI0010C1BC8D|nr:GntR family transcriptional regulator [Streptomyces sp. BPSDS2]